MDTEVAGLLRLHNHLLNLCRNVPERGECAEIRTGLLSAQRTLAKILAMHSMRLSPQVRRDIIRVLARARFFNEKFPVQESTLKAPALSILHPSIHAPSQQQERG
jgi:hypothetical protein